MLCKGTNQSDTTVVLGPNAVKCSLATVPSHAVLSRAHDETTQARDISTVLSSLDNLFGLDEDAHINSGPAFHIFHPFEDNPNIIFPVIFYGFGIEIKFNLIKFSGGFKQFDVAQCERAERRTVPEVDIWRPSTLRRTQRRRHYVTSSVHDSFSRNFCIFLQ